MLWFYIVHSDFGRVKGVSYLVCLSKTWSGRLAMMIRSVFFTFFLPGVFFIENSRWSIRLFFGKYPHGSATPNYTITLGHHAFSTWRCITILLPPLLFLKKFMSFKSASCRWQRSPSIVSLVPIIPRSSQKTRSPNDLAWLTNLRLEFLKHPCFIAGDDSMQEPHLSVAFKHHFTSDFSVRMPPFNQFMQYQ